MDAATLSTLNALDLQVVAKHDGRDVNRRELSTAFDWVSPRPNWKAPIACTVALSDRQAALVALAVEFFTGAKPTKCERVDGPYVRVEAIGYYAAVGA